MLHLVLGIISIGLVLYFWERFPSFKWVLATIVAIPILLIAVLFFVDHNKNLKKEREQTELNQRYEREQKIIEQKNAKESYENLKNIKASIDRRLKEDAYDSDDEKQKDVIASKQFEIMVNEARLKIE